MDRRASGEMLKCRVDSVKPGGTHANHGAWLG